jgi:hypothetical protein
LLIEKIYIREKERLNQFINILGTINREAGKFYHKNVSMVLYKHITHICKDVPPPPPPLKKDLLTGFLSALYMENRRKKKSSYI